MLKDRESNKIRLSDTDNGHRLLLGKSGSGKTYCCYRMIEEAMSLKKRGIIFDCSGSYALTEMEKAKFKYISHTSCIIDGAVEGNIWLYEKTNLRAALPEGIIKALHIKSIKQKDALYEAASNLATQRKINMSDMLAELKKIGNAKKKQNQKAIEELVDRLKIYTEVDISFQKNINDITEKKDIMLIQLSELEVNQRVFWRELLTELLWCEIRKNGRWIDYVLYDECREMPLGKGSTLEMMLLEGRKFGLAVWLATQHISNRNPAEKDNILQVGNLLLFKQTSNNVNTVARLINMKKSKEWSGILSGLGRGEFVLCGSFLLNDRCEICDEPIVGIVSDVI